MKIKIIYPFKNGPWGGANQFLKALKNEMVSLGVYTNEDNESEVFLINSINAFHDFIEVFKLKKKYPNAYFVHRVDGPVYLIRDKNLCIDKGIFKINDCLADGTIFQTEWSKQNCINLGMKDNKPSATICNGSNEQIFFAKSDKPLHHPMKIIATSWSANANKGFEYYKYLDENIDLARFNFTFVGNSPILFKNGTTIPAQESEKLAELLRDSDIYITASRKDPCSNSLIEALSCGLPAIVLNDGGHPYIVGKAGKTFENEPEMMEALEYVANNYDELKEQIPNYGIKNVAEQYVSFMETVCKSDNPVTKVKFFDYFILVIYKLTYNFEILTETLKQTITRRVE